MTNPILDSLNMHVLHTRSQTAGGAHLQGTGVVKEQLLAELVALGKQMTVLEASDARIDFSMLQTYKEMIQSRKRFFNQLG